VLRRSGEQWITEIVCGPAGILSLSSVPFGISMAELYEGILGPQPAGQQLAS
jgi:hypothetical protein